MRPIQFSFIEVVFSLQDNMAGKLSSISLLISKAIIHFYWINKGLMFREATVIQDNSHFHFLNIRAVHKIT